MIADSLFVSEKVHERIVKLPDGAEHKLWFKELPAVEFRKFWIAENNDDPEIQAASIARLIAASLCDESGKPALTYQQALKLTAPAANAISASVLDVNGFGVQAKND